jgi:septal ring factor EnvC (AmiA/AmiB activator)
MEQEIREIIRRELPRLLTEDPELHNWVWTIVHEHSFSRAETESRFDRVLDEMRQSREEWMRRWEENERRWKENERRWEENQRRWEENERRWKQQWEEDRRRWEENARLWRENEERWKENERRWEENQQQIRALLEELHWARNFSVRARDFSVCTGELTRRLALWARAGA